MYYCFAGQIIITHHGGQAEWVTRPKGYLVTIQTNQCLKGLLATPMRTLLLKSAPYKGIKSVFFLCSGSLLWPARWEEGPQSIGSIKNILRFAAMVISVVFVSEGLLMNSNTLPVQEPQVLKPKTRPWWGEGPLACCGITILSKLRFF